jgi:glycosyltransferase involved in cell wall biosynthesis
VNGYLAEPGDDAMLAQHLSTVLALAPKDWLRMSQAAHSTASALTWERSTSLFEAALMRAVARSETHAVASSSAHP